MDYDPFSVLANSGLSRTSLADLGSLSGNAYTFNKFLLDLIGCNVPVCEPTEVEQGDLIGAGATMSVFRGQWKGKAIAVKTFSLFDPTHETLERDDSRIFAQRLRSAAFEVRVMSLKSLNSCGNVVSLLGASWTMDPHSSRLQPMLMVELADYAETTLAAALPFEAPNVGLKSTVIWGIANGLRALHSHNIIHGDLKPSNILLFQGSDTSYPVPKLSDFGFCQPETISLSGIEPASEKERIALFNAAVGTEYWSAPECLPDSILREYLELIDPEKLPEDFDAREEFDKLLKRHHRDIFSFGLVAMAILFGSNPCGPDSGSDYESLRMAIWEFKLTGGLREKFREGLYNRLRLVDRSGNEVSIPPIRGVDGQELKPDTGEQMSRSRFTMMHMYLLSKDKSKEDLTASFKALWDSGVGHIKRNDGVNLLIRSGEIRWQFQASPSAPWRETEGLMPVEVMLLHQTLEFIPENRFQAVDWIERLRPLQYATTTEPKPFDPQEMFYLPQGSTDIYRAESSISVRGDYQDSIPQSMWRSAVKQIIADASRAEAEPEECFFLADCYIGGHGVIEDIDEALKWILKAAKESQSEANRQKGRFCYLNVLFNHKTAADDPNLASEELKEWLIEIFQCNGTVPQEFGFEALKQQWTPFAEKLRDDLGKVVPHDDGLALLSALGAINMFWRRNAVFYEEPSEVHPLARLLLVGDRGLSLLQALLVNTLATSDAVRELATESLYRRMAASSSARVFTMLSTFLASGMVGGGNSFDLMFGNFDNDQKVSFHCDVDSHDTHEHHPVLFTAMGNENWSTFHYFLSGVRSKSLINYRWRNHTPLFHAITLRNPLFVTALLVFGANPNEGIWRDNGELVLTPLQLACCSVGPFAEPFEPNNCLFNESGSQFERVVKDESYDRELRMLWIVQALVSMPKIDINHCPYQKLPPLHYAAGFGKHRIVQVLLEAGANQCPYGNHCMSSAFMSGEKNCLTTIQLLLQHGADPNSNAVKDTYKGRVRTPLCIAVAKCWPDVVRTLLHAGADPNADECLHAAAFHGGLEMINLLIDAGADKSKTNEDGATPADIFEAVYSTTRTIEPEMRQAISYRLGPARLEQLIVERFKSQRPSSSQVQPGADTSLPKRSSKALSLWRLFRRKNRQY